MKSKSATPQEQGQEKEISKEISKEIQKIKKENSFPLILISLIIIPLIALYYYFQNCNKFICLLLFNSEYQQYELSRDKSPLYTTFYSLSYKQENLYEKGPRDILLVTTLTLSFYILDKLLKSTLSSLNFPQRFSEQFYLFIYYTISFSFGLVIYNQSQYAFNLPALWSDYPLYKIPLRTKIYYLSSLGFWIYQLITYTFLPVSDRRKDHLQMLAHHFITTLLILLSYVFHFTNIGNLVLIIMDFSDIFLSLAKCLKYCKSKVCDFVFCVFVLSWVYTRHYLLVLVVCGIFFDAPGILSNIHYDDYFSRNLLKTNGLDMEAVEKSGNYFSVFSWVLFLTLFTGLEALLCFWFVLICGVIKKVVSGDGASDSREDDE